jgi:tetratricopeptide (TPR) repeat protein
MGADELSRIIERDGDLIEAIAWQRRAVMHASYQPNAIENAAFSLRLGALLRRVGDHNDAVQAFSDATIADPVNGAAWSALRNTLFDLGRLPEALEAAKQALDYDPNTQATQNALERIRTRLPSGGSALGQPTTSSPHKPAR